MDGQDGQLMGWWCLVGRAGLKPAPTGWLDGEGWVLLWLAWPRSAPGPHPNPLPSNGRGGMFVADECTPMMGMLLFGWWVV